MNASVNVLKEGYSRWMQNGRMSANGSCTLIKSSGMYILVDTLGPWDSDILRALLQKHSIHPEDISLLVCTHGHTDHIGNLNMFLRCKHIVGECLYEKDVYETHDFEQQPYIVSPNVRVIATPGHTLSDVSVVVENVDKLGTVAVVGDLFEKEEDVNDASIWKDAGSESPEKQESNRATILQISDYIVPGHGPMFSVNRS
ncbi:Metallo-beta-lactamase domain-containing protein 1-like protein [Leptotrombidium deliense]|uniref:Metallo-beta-lactamase domain-containing protein 1 n=1 Tax=Leptotrombidium deliense TaxID=299467 RepID=A0A443SVA7_9ACAR|nr:Metallo-beta-lactamase domain-containing protein 1-like protein [Leptotrombidium deliense]